jgi:hypothetical protein
VFEAALDWKALFPDHDDRTYDVAADYVPSAESFDPTAAAPLGASVVDAYPQRNSKVLTYAHATPAEAAELRERSILREFWCRSRSSAGASRGSAQIVMKHGQGAALLADRGAIAGIASERRADARRRSRASSKLMSIDFGAIPEPGPESDGDGRARRGGGGPDDQRVSQGDMNGPIIALHVVVILYWVLFYTFFEMDLQEC